MQEKNIPEGNDLAVRLTALGSQILSASRDELYLGMRFLDVALSSFVYQMDVSINPFGTDGNTIYFHPQHLGGLYRQNRILVNRGYLHMVFHCIFRHMIKPGMDGTYWNLSCDIAAEHMADGNYHRSVRFSKSLLRRETYRKLELQNKVLNAESIYTALLSWELSKKDLVRLEKEFYVDDHKYWENQQPRQKPDPNLENKWKHISERMETELDTFSKEAAENSGDLLGQIKVENKERHDYREFLRKFSVFCEEIAVDPDSFDYTFYSYGLRLYGNMPLIEPQETKEVKKISEFVVVIDTSMSCSQELVQIFLEETYSILSETESFFKKMNIHILQCDEKVHFDKRITSAEELKEYMENLTLYGQGGTDFRPAFAYVDEMLGSGEFENLRGLIYFTDGRGIYPRKMPSYKTAFVFIEDEYEDVNVPPWAVKLLLDEDELRNRE
ncbi:MAG: VWA-like domain-containing protein [Muricomes sp.]